MKYHFSLTAVLAFLVPALIFAAKPGAQVGAAQDQDQGTKDSPNVLAGDGIPNNTQDEEYGAYGAGESPNELSGDGIPNASQDEEYGKYGTTGEPGSQGGAYQGDGAPKIQAREQVQTQNAGEDAAIATQLRAQNSEELKGVLEQVRAEVRAERGTESGTRAQVRADREGAEVAMRGAFAAGPLFGEQEPRMYELAARMGEQSEQALLAEVQARERSTLARFFMGGDRDAAQKLDAAVAQNRETIREMKQLVDGCTTCDDATRSTIREQLRVLEEEQIRLEERATQERARTGLFGWLFD